MTTQGNVVGRDPLGKEILWSSLGQQVMMEWEKQYMRQCVDALEIRPMDRVLEIGFGLAYSASHIQSFAPAQHTIIECDREVLLRAAQFESEHSGVHIVAGTWQQMLPILGEFDCVFFDDYPLPELLTAQGGSLQAGGDGLSGVRPRSRWHDFLDVVLHHCAAGARISGYLARSLDLRRPGCEVSMTRVQVATPVNCNYFPHETALVPVITVVAPAVAAGNGTTNAQPTPMSVQASRKFQHAFEKARTAARTPTASFSAERSQIAEIREFLLAHEMDALSHDEREDECGDDDMMEGDAECSGSTQGRFEIVLFLHRERDEGCTEEAVKELIRK
ncbi:hypothetical protein BBJ28_00005843 [Nothophytophthora sp. Chile5]|nr:hypothetical protein BBJ28_00005843 [Nothophytophthora sp. Chile5]